MYKKMYFLLLFFSFSSLASVKSYSYWFAPNHYEFLLDEKRSKYLGDYDISVFQFYAGYLERLDDKMMRNEFATLKKHNIAISIEAPPLVVPNLGRASEGFGHKDSIKNLLVRIKSNGGDIKFITMDEPIMAWYKMHNHSLSDSDIRKLVEELSEVTNDIYSIFPNVKIGDVEPLNQFDGDEEMIFSSFIDYYNKRFENKLSFLHYDLSWGGGWKSKISSLIGLADNKSINTGVIFNSQNTGGTTTSWMHNAEDNIESYKSLNIPSLQHIIVQSWSKYPLAITPNDSKTNSYHMYLLEILGAKVTH